jgi:hypothetical protein
MGLSVTVVPAVGMPMAHSDFIEKFSFPRNHN